MNSIFENETIVEYKWSPLYRLQGLLGGARPPARTEIGWVVRWSCECACVCDVRVARSWARQDVIWNLDAPERMHASMQGLAVCCRSQRVECVAACGLSRINRTTLHSTHYNNAFSLFWGSFKEQLRITFLVISKSIRHQFYYNNWCNILFLSNIPVSMIQFSYWSDEFSLYYRLNLIKN